MVNSRFIFAICPVGFKRDRNAPGLKIRQFLGKNGIFLEIEAPPLIGERRPSCYHRLWISRKFYKKVTGTIFANEIRRIRRFLRVETDLFPPVNKIF
jgi:hypothetical protein